MKLIFWIALVGCLYSYAIYPALLTLVPARNRTARRGSPAAWPMVSLVIACRNEAGRLRHKLDNALDVAYPNLEIVVASDASDDGSDDIAREFGTRGIRLVRSPERRGKEYAQGLAVSQTAGDVLVFSDVGTDLPVHSIRIMVENFDDPTIGAVSSEDQFVTEDGKVAGEGAYVRYEMWLRRLESQRAGLVGLSGSFFAVRRSVLREWNATVPSDFACALQAVRAGLRAISDPRVVGIYRDIKDPLQEFSRKVRTAVRGMTAVAVMREVLNPVRYGLFSFQVWGHKIMRWLVPWFMLALLIASAALAHEPGVYSAVLAVQGFGYGIAAAAFLIPASRRNAIIRLIYFFVQVNLALARAGIDFACGRRIVTWEPSVR